MERRTTSWYSPNLNMEMPLVAYGHAGQTLLMLPTAAADYLEYERFYLVDAIKPFVEAGLIRAYSINSVNRHSLLNEQMPPHLKAELLTRYDRYITAEVLPLIRREAGEEARPITTGASLGAFLAVLLIAAINARFQRDFAQEWIESLRVKHKAPLGEAELARLARKQK